ncbi:MAG: hypothetical protein WBL31_04515 [Ilumatobacteraceae bacterium]
MSSAVSDPPRIDAPVATSLPRDSAWSRAGAIAVVLAGAPSTRAIRFSVRVALLVAGSVTVAVGHRIVHGTVTRTRARSVTYAAALASAI